LAVGSRAAGGCCLPHRDDHTISQTPTTNRSLSIQHARRHWRFTEQDVANLFDVCADDLHHATSRQGKK
jgi:hypothetical protein